MKDLYKILGLTNRCTSEDIKKAYRNLAKKYHPDVVGDDAEMNRQFQEIKEAYKILENEQKRKGYDAMQARLNRAEENEHQIEENIGEHEEKTDIMGSSFVKNRDSKSLFKKIQSFLRH